MLFRVLGELDVEDGTGKRAVRGVRLRSLLAVLLLNANQRVTTDRLQDALWGEEPPASGAAAVHNLAARLRRTVFGDEPDRLTATPLGYLLRVDDGELDSALFEQHLATARAAVLAAEWESVHREASGALALWRGVPLAELPELADAGPARERWQEARLQALEWRLDAELRLGRSTGLVPELARLVDEHPLRETFHQQLMLALHRAGRRAQALAAYRRLHRTLRDELGVEPGREAQRIHQDILLAPEPEPAAPPARPAAPGRPAQLPADTADFTGREEELGRLRDHLAKAASGCGPSVLVVSGMGGVGKTALAVRAAHQAKELFPDGQLYVDLHGFGNGERREAHEILARFLADLSPDPCASPLPEHTDDRAARLRDVLATRRLLLLLDNARDAQHLLPLMPGDGRSAVLATSRNTLTDLPGAVQVRLEPLDIEEQRRLLSAVCGPDRACADLDNALRLLAACGGLPLALRVVAARLAARPAWSLETMAQHLSDDGRRLRSLSAGQLSVRDTFATSYLVLRESDEMVEREAARLFRLLGLWPGLVLGVEQAAALGQRPVADTADLLELLTDYHLLQSPEPWRYRFHDLLGEYAAERAEYEETPESRDAARVRLMVWYAAALENTRAAIYAGVSITPVLEEAPTAPPPVFAEGEDATRWCNRELANIREVVRQATCSSRPDFAWRLVVGLSGYDATWFWTGETDDLRAMALRSAREQGDLVGQARVLERIGIVHGMAYRNEQAIDALQAALDAAEQARREDLAIAVLQNLAVAHNHKRDGAASLAYARQALTRDDSEESSGFMLNTMAVSHLLLEDFAAAEAGLRQALEIWRCHGNVNNTAITLANLGDALRGLGRRDEALAALDEARRHHQRLGNNEGVADCLVVAGRTHLHFGGWDDARTCFQQAMDIAREHDLQALTARATEGLDELDRLRGCPEEMRRP
ncbi:tetratricopeptide repeat protein [Streptomyces kaniharaensis]|uniref:Tetratricopeptide repeat protein n=1 Tax=Streptomyces kaniharaensis TaxID=212423 RepID=A0A6N7KWR0_9ACTN|nr:BTAD domain-containing putative transcriptional regulator [Streptomyces kaniharaensis]MQS16102.1 tetratricopeptide repeat protein [Streptomyces kaniharaensis]